MQCLDPTLVVYFPTFFFPSTSQENFGIIWYSAVFKLVYAVLSVLIMAQIVTAYSNGNPTANPEIQTDRWYVRPKGNSTAEGEHFCVSAAKDNDQGEPGAGQYELVDCCTWETDGGAIAWIVFAIWLLSWISFTLFELRTFFTAGPEQGDRVEATRNPPS